MNEEVLFLSLRPRFARAVFEGSKTVELRRTRPRVSRDSRILVYESAPKSALVGVLVVEAVVEGSVEDVWAKVAKFSGVSNEEFLSYFEGAETAFAIFLKGAHEFQTPVDLKTLRKRFKRFSPPQSFHYLPAEKAESLAQVSFDEQVERKLVAVA